VHRSIEGHPVPEPARELERDPLVATGDARRLLVADVGQAEQFSGRYRVGARRGGDLRSREDVGAGAGIDLESLER
jgi:hypothetical protein